MNPYAVVWSFIAAIGAILSLMLLIQAIADLRALGTIQNGRRAIVRGRLASEAIRLVAQAAYLLIGLAAIGTEVRNPGVWIVLTAGSAALIINSLISLYVRQAIKASSSEPLTADELLIQASEKAALVLLEAKRKADDVLDVARRTASELDRVQLERTLNRSTDAAERTAENTARIADNTAPPDDGA